MKKRRPCAACRRVIPAGYRNCPGCATDWKRRRRAVANGEPLCQNGHAVMSLNTSVDGRQCADCHRLGLDYIEPLNLRPDETWLDWGAVLRAMHGDPLPRKLTRREILCMAETLRVRYGLANKLGGSWIAESTHVDLGRTPWRYLEYLEQRWATASRAVRRMKYLVLTVEEAMFREIDGTIDEEWPDGQAPAQAAA